MNSTHISPETQHEHFRAAVKALGGQRPTARYLGTNERTIRRLYSGNQKLHDGWLRDIAEALVVHAGLCRMIEEKLHPAFSKNLTAEQAEQIGKRDGRRSDG